MSVAAPSGARTLRVSGAPQRASCTGCWSESSMPPSNRQKGSPITATVEPIFVHRSGDGARITHGVRRQVRVHPARRGDSRYIASSMKTFAYVSSRRSSRDPSCPATRGGVPQSPLRSATERYLPCGMRSQMYARLIGARRAVRAGRSSGLAYERTPNAGVARRTRDGCCWDQARFTFPCSRRVTPLAHGRLAKASVDLPLVG